MVKGKAKVMEARKSVPETAAMSEPPEPGATFTNEPLAIEETAREVVVALVVVALVAVKSWRVVEPATRKLELTVDEALEKKPLKRARVVEVACIVPLVKNG